MESPQFAAGLTIELRSQDWGLPRGAKVGVTVAGECRVWGIPHPFRMF